MNKLEFIKKWWRECAIICLIVLVIIFARLNEEKQDALDTIANSVSTQHQISTINAHMPTVNDHETNIYPKIDAQLKELNKNIKYLSETVKRLEANRPTKEDSYAIFQNQSTSQISRFFSDRGFNNTIINLPSK